MNKVLIAGGGPVGLVMALELARHGIRSRIIDKLIEPLPYCRALGVTARTLEVFEDMGVADDIINAGIWITGRRISVAGQPANDYPADAEGLPYNSLSIPQPKTERILAEHLSIYGIDIERGVSLIDAEQLQNEVNVTLQDRDGNIEKASFEYVIGCDGAHSKVRQIAGIAFEGERFPYDFMLGDVRVDWDLPRGYGFQSIYPVKGSAPDFLMAVPLPRKNRYRVSMLAPSGNQNVNEGSDHGIQSERPAPGIELLQQSADRLVPGGATLSDLRWSSIFRISLRLADRYREKRLFLAGDAAHIHPPTGGQGMNTGIQDAYNLAWKLALVLKGIANEGLLDSYNEERREEGMNVLERTMQATLQVDGKGFKTDKFVDAQMRVSYRNSSFIVHDEKTDRQPGTLQAGDRAPDCDGLVRKGVGRPFRLFDILHGTQHGLLIDMRDHTSSVWHALQDKMEQWTKSYGKDFLNSLRVVVISLEAGMVAPFPNLFCVEDRAENFAHTYPSQNNTSWLIRPDGYIGCVADWRGGGLSDYFDKIFS